MQWDFRTAIRDLADIGLLDIILPFFLIFTVIYAILERSHILGPTGTARRFNVIVAMVIGFLVIVPHVLYGDPTGQSSNLSIQVGGKYLPDVVNIINNAIPAISIWIIAVLMLMILIGMFGADIEIMGTSLGSWIFLGAVAIVFYTFAVAANWLQAPNWLSWLNYRSNQAVILILLIFGVVIWFVVSPERGRKKGGLQGVLDAIQSAIRPQAPGGGTPPR
jgi:hypothetical protein